MPACPMHAQTSPPSPPPSERGAGPGRGAPRASEHPADRCPAGTQRSLQQLPPDASRANTRVESE
eukprot:3850041-Alexandrium_andersonii.AAC.1